MELLKKEVKGILLAAALGLAAYFFAPWLGINSLMLGLLLGMALGNVFTISASFQSGISFTSSKLLEISIIFLAFSINFSHVSALGWTPFGLIALMVIAMVLITYYLAQRMHCPGSTGWLVGFGTAICGSSAIAALAPSVSPQKEDVAISMAVVNLLGSLGMVLFPFMLAPFAWGNLHNGIILGGGLHSVGNVAGAAYSMGAGVGDAAITVKLARVAMLSPGLILFNYLINKGKDLHWREHFKLPWYVWTFVLITILTTVWTLPSSLLSSLDTIGKVILTIAMVAIGLKVRISALLKSGRRGLGFGVVILLIQMVFLFTIVLFLGLRA
ncbi:putative sulfate exporter family transporter [Cytophagales bacterium LB-30]|uniref:Sulfate exporter family transporter n=1 Tax=Shiella aurantiaca TaxID=3058365 RepID=A0ABT8F8H8_9BACT|nr:putative sulfate exporter family transporter [Shiella aurantiaca]MDN4166685.1 putative sulfate exporter family transporter [Shiella aurantiaca]